MESTKNEAPKEEKKEETKTEPPKQEEKKVEEPKKEEPKKEEPKEEEPKKEEKKILGDEFEIPIKKEIDEKIGIKNMVGDDIHFTEAKTWKTLGVKESIEKGLLDMDFLFPSKIQATTFPIIMKDPRFNVIAQIKNCSGKTGAFGL